MLAFALLQTPKPRNHYIKRTVYKPSPRPLGKEKGERGHCFFRNSQTLSACFSGEIPACFLNLRPTEPVNLFPGQILHKRVLATCWVVGNFNVQNTFLLLVNCIVKYEVSFHTSDNQTHLQVACLLWLDFVSPKEINYAVLVKSDLLLAKPVLGLGPFLYSFCPMRNVMHLNPLQSKIFNFCLLKVNPSVSSSWYLAIKNLHLFGRHFVFLTINDHVLIKYVRILLFYKARSNNSSS